MSDDLTPTPRDPYQRPQQLWQCAHACSRPCNLGPTAWGFCRENTEPCRPRLSILGQRGLWVGTCFLFTLACVLWSSWPQWQHRMVSPGALTSVHAQALQTVSQGNNCEACHQPGARDLVGWLTQTPVDSAASHAHQTQSEQCLACHGPVFANRNFLTPHNLAADELATITTRHREQPVSFYDSWRVKFDSTQSMACATCHREHEGMQANISEMTNRQCQACHTHTIHSFEQGHPEFRDKERYRSNIAFDHVAHFKKHFPGKQHEFQCSQCHTDDADRNVKKLVDFQQACAQCHTKPIEASSMDGLIVFSLPTLNVSQLTAKGISVGYWPTEAQGDFEGTFSPLLLALLAADPQANSALDLFGYDFDFENVNLEVAQQREAIISLVHAYKRLLLELANAPEATLKDRLEKIAGNSRTDAAWKQIARQLPPAIFREAQRRWFPNLSEELANSRQPNHTLSNALAIPVYRNERETQLKATSPINLPGITWWTRSDQSQLVTSNNSKPTATLDRHLAENPLRHLAIEKTKPTSLIATSKESKIPIATNPKDSNSPISSGEKLADNPLKMLIHGTPFSQDVPLTKSNETPDVQPIAKKDTPDVSPKLTAATAYDLSTNGAWFIDQETLSIRYRPVGHGDELLRIILDTSAQASQHSLTQNLLAFTLRNQATKSCTSCHSISSEANVTQVHWQASYRDTSRFSFTSFSHRPHIIQPTLQNCTHCHNLNEAANVLENYEGTQPQRLVHDFLPVKQQQCVSCHNSTNAGGNCTQCHNYHVGMKRSH
jgi:Cytochrome c7 and related cytochrome c